MAVRARRRLQLAFQQLLQAADALGFGEQHLQRPGLAQQLGRCLGGQGTKDMAGSLGVTESEW